MNEFALLYDIGRLLLFLILFAWAMYLVVTTVNTIYANRTELANGEMDLFPLLWKNWLPFVLVGCAGYLVMSYVSSSTPKFSNRMPAPPPVVDFKGDPSKAWINATRKKSDADRLKENRDLYNENAIGK